MNKLYPENSYSHKCLCGTDFLAPKGSLHCHACLYNKIAELEKKSTKHIEICERHVSTRKYLEKRIAELKEQKKYLIEEFAEAECMGDLAKIARNYGYIECGAE